MVLSMLLLSGTLTLAQQDDYFWYPVWHPTEDIIAVTNGAAVRLYSSDFTQLLDEYPLVEQVSAGLRPGHMAWSPDGTMLAVSLTGEGIPFKLQVWSLQTGQRLIQIDRVITDVPFVWGDASDRIGLVHSADQGDDTIRVYAIPGGALVQEFAPASPSNIQAFAWSPAKNQALVYLAGANPGLYAVDTISGVFTLINRDFNRDYRYQYNPSGSLIAGGQSADVTVVEVLDTDTFEVVTTLVGHSDWVFKISWINDNTIATVSWDETTRFWNAETGQQLVSFQTGLTTAPTFSPDDTLFVATSIDENTYVRDVATGAVVAILDGSDTATTTLTP
jgi:WD40 repeat protein